MHRGFKRAIRATRFELAIAISPGNHRGIGSLGCRTPRRIIRSMNIVLNGQAFEVPPTTTVAGLVEMRRASGHLKTPAYAVERNREVVARREHEKTVLAAGDKVEIVVMVGGG